MWSTIFCITTEIPPNTETQVKSWFSRYQKKKAAAATGAASTTKGGKGGKKASGSTGSQPGSSSSAALDIDIDMEAEDKEEILQQIDVQNFEENVESILTD